MRCNPWRWLWGVIPIAMLTWLAFTWEREGIETDLRSRSEAALESEGFAWGQVSLDGRDAHLSGVAPDESEPYRAAETVRNVRGVRIVRSRTDAGPRVAAVPSAADEPGPSVQAIEPPAADVQGLSDAERAELEARSAAAREHERRWRAARVQGGEETPRVVEPESAPEPEAAPVDMAPLSAADRAEWEARWAEARDHERRWRSDGAGNRANGAEDAAGQRADAEAKARDEDEARLAAEAERQRRAAEDEEAARAAEAERQRAAEDEARRRDAEQAALAAEAERQRAAEDDAKRREAADAARAAEAEKERLAEEQREQAAAEAEAQRLADEQAKAEEEAAAKRKADDDAAAAKRAEDEAAAKRQEEQDVAVARQKDAEEAKRKAEADHCQGLMRSAMAEGMLNFARAKADITRDSYLTLDRLAGIAKVCPQARISIAGHTDSEGEPERNQGLSERRAKAVADYLVGKGVDPSRLKSEGFGETRPLAPNDTPEGMRQNRRIEFSVSPAS